MNASWIAASLGLLAISAAAQVTPASPKKFTTRPIGSRSGVGAEVIPPPEDPKTRHITYFVLSESREWTSADGKPITGKLIAFENLVVDMPKGSAQADSPVPPVNPTVISAGKLRLLVNNKPFEVPLERLSQEDREFAENVRAAHAKKAAALPDGN
jgi:hypothetical protein